MTLLKVLVFGLNPIHLDSISIWFKEGIHIEIFPKISISVRNIEAQLDVHGFWGPIPRQKLKKRHELWQDHTST